MDSSMTSGSIFKTILKFMFPLFIGNVFQQLYNMADTIIVGRFVGPNALAAVGSTGTIMFLILGVSIGLTTGFTVLTSQAYGAGDEGWVHKTVANAMILSMIVVLVMTFLSAAGMGQVLRLMNTPDDIYQDAYTYIMIISLGIISSVLYNLASALLRSVGNSKVPLYILVFSAFLNVGLDLLLIIVFKMGVAGAALATVVSQLISALMGFAYIAKNVPVLRPSREDFRLYPEITKKQLAIAIPMALQFGITASGTMIMQAAINKFGATAVAAYTAASKLHTVLTQEMIAMGQAMAAYAGQNFGFGDYSRLKNGVRAACIIEFVYSCIASVACYILMPLTIGFFFTGDVNLADMMPWAETYVTTVIVFYIPLSVIFVFRNTMQGCGYGFLPMMGGVVEFFARLFTAMIAIHLANFRLAVACDPAAWVAAAVFTGASWFFISRKIKQQLAR